MTTHFTTLSLVERHRELEDARRASLGLPSEPRACRVCYVKQVGSDCPCGRNDWTYLTVVVIELELLIESLQRRQLNCTGSANCEHCLQTA
jgi:hypothetical protein